MSKRAEQAALKVYPLKDYTKEPNYIHTCDTKMLDEVYRDVFRIGYEQAEKDLALTTDDIRLIIKINYEIVFKDTTGIKVGDVASEVLRRFRETKNK